MLGRKFSVGVVILSVVRKRKCAQVRSRVPVTIQTITKFAHVVGVALQLKELVELELRAIRTIYARKNLRRAPFDIWVLAEVGFQNFGYITQRRR